MIKIYPSNTKLTDAFSNINTYIIHTYIKINTTWAVFTWFKGSEKKKKTCHSNFFLFDANALRHL